MIHSPFVEGQDILHYREDEEVDFDLGQAAQFPNRPSSRHICQEHPEVVQCLEPMARRPEGYVGILQLSIPRASGASHCLSGAEGLQDVDLSFASLDSHLMTEGWRVDALEAAMRKKSWKSSL